MCDVNYLRFDQAQDLVERIADRAKVFKYVMSVEEKEAMSELLSEIGVRTSDLIDIRNMADNYAINAEIVTPDDVQDYDAETLDDNLFSWYENGKKFYCLSW
jgi:hypothetical protein